jgi:hypothetical protein
MTDHLSSPVVGLSRSGLSLPVESFRNSHAHCYQLLIKLQPSLYQLIKANGILLVLEIDVVLAISLSMKSTKVISHQWGGDSLSSRHPKHLVRQFPGHVTKSHHCGSQ